MKFIKGAFGEFNEFNMRWSLMLDSVYYGLLNVILLPSQFVLISIKKIELVVTDIVMTLLVPAVSAM